MNLEHNPEKDLTMAKYLLDNINMASEGIEPSDFALSFGLVRDVWDLYISMKTLEESIKK